MQDADLGALLGNDRDEIRRGPAPWCGATADELLAKLLLRGDCAHIGRDALHNSG
ncbi:MAG: hypothetical protein QOF14_5728 [Hyphomicrobiales bacterium]|nr:hypothetical protein [Hyphomicrobiales bacterium]